MAELFVVNSVSPLPRSRSMLLESFSSLAAYSGERERPFWLNVNTFFLNASPTGVCTLGVHVQSIS